MSILNHFYKEKLFKNRIMKSLKILLGALIISILLLPGCGNDKSETIKETKTVKEVSKISSKKKKKKDKPQMNTTVKVEASINGKKIDFDKVDPKHNSVVVLFNESFQLKYVDMKNQVVLVHLYDVNLYKSTPIIFTQQIAALPPKGQVLVKVKSSKLSFSITNNEGQILSMPELYQGDVILKEFTEDKILISFKGKGFSIGGSTAKSKLFPMEGTIVIENYNIYDARR